MKHKILVTGKVREGWAEELFSIATVDVWDHEEVYLMPREELLARVTDCDAVINFTDVKVDEIFVKNAARLKIVANCAIGYDNLNLPLLTAHKIWATNTPGYFSYPVAEYVFAGILLMSRRLLEADDFVRNGAWKVLEPGRWDGSSIREKTIGIVGMGEIGLQLRKMLLDIGAKVIYYAPRQKDVPGAVSFESLLHDADIVSVHVPLNHQTEKLFDAGTIKKMKPGSILVNTSRGKVVDSAALIAALTSGHLAAAVLDVVETEPDVPEELRKMKNVLLTPHISGGTLWSRKESFRLAAENVRAALSGMRPPNALNDL